MASGGKDNWPPPLVDVSERQKLEDEYRQQLLQLEKEIQTLKKVLQAKAAEACELRNKLGISPMNELKEDIRSGIQAIQDSDAMQKTNAAVKSIGQYASKAVESLKNSSAVKSIEDKVGTAYNTVKQRISNSNIFGAPAADGKSAGSDVTARTAEDFDNKCNMQTAENQTKTGSSKDKTDKDNTNQTGASPNKQLDKNIPPNKEDNAGNKCNNNNPQSLSDDSFVIITGSQSLN
ncbi:hypothetical protein HELRODRAFT_161564 [Helobdella robusta]|uniref:Tumor protein D52 n=1 Tax=Helobdella robusta TaxID=6412 RepID=T1ERM2_HELRO|nr:hypothetical protein HELRODRAFT_161564 [Helobdella robusta]ESO02309.1 hypothetical protein HELRODRAFT_161564 [Helobdella robusta]